MADRDELRAIYGQETLSVPPYRPTRLVRHPDRVFATRNAKLAALCDDVAERNRTGQPVLVGTASVEDAEDISKLLDQRGVKHGVITAREHGREAQILADAGRSGAVTVAARYAGRGVDVVVENDATGLCVIAAERFDSVRHDQQLAGRTARNGAPGEFVAYVSCEDELLRVYGGSALEAAINTVRGSEAEQLQVPGIAALLDRAQRQLANMEATARAELLARDDLRESATGRFMTWRGLLLGGEDLRPALQGLYHRRMQATAAPWRRRVDHQRLGGSWPEDRPLPVPTGAGWAHALAEDAHLGLLSRSRESLGTSGDQAAVRVVREALLEVADSEWAALLGETEVLIAAHGNGPSQLLAGEMYRAEQTFWERLDVRIATIVWAARFRPTDGDVRPGGDPSPSGS